MQKILLLSISCRPAICFVEFVECELPIQSCVVETNQAVPRKRPNTAKDTQPAKTVPNERGQGLAAARLGGEEEMEDETEEAEDETGVGTSLAED